MKTTGLAALAAVFAILTVSLHAAVSLNQIEDFSGVHAWSGGNPNPNPPVVLPDSGPLGSGDSSLRIISSGSAGPGGRLIVFNQSLWTGDFTAQGISSITADLRNLGQNTLSIRLAFNGPGGRFVTTESPLLALSGWTEQTFDIRPTALTSVGGGNVTSTMAAVTEMRILHSDAVDFRGAQVSSSFLVDNLKAVPESTAAMVIGLIGLLLLFRKR